MDADERARAASAQRGWRLCECGQRKMNTLQLYARTAVWGYRRACAACSAPRFRSSDSCRRSDGEHSGVSAALACARAACRGGARGAGGGRKHPPCAPTDVPPPTCRRPPRCYPAPRTPRLQAQARGGRQRVSEARRVRGRCLARSTHAVGRRTRRQPLLCARPPAAPACAPRAASPCLASARLRAQTGGRPRASARVQRGGAGGEAAGGAPMLSITVVAKLLVPLWPCWREERASVYASSALPASPCRRRRLPTLLHSAA